MSRKMPKKHVAGPEELANDPSLRWCGYRTFELVWSDSHSCEMRFHRYLEDGTVELATEAGMTVIPGRFSALSIRRPTARPVQDAVWAGKYGGGPRPKTGR